MASLKNLIFLILLVPFAFPLNLGAETETKKKPDILLLTDWKPLPDRTMILQFGGDLYRHHILTSSPKHECDSVSVNSMGEIRLITRNGNSAWEYLVSFNPVFYSSDGRNWIFIPDRKINE